MTRAPLLLIHGGAGSRSVPSEKYELYLKSLQAILASAYPLLLKRGGNALTAAVRAVELLEDDPLYNAGKGSKIQSDGRIRMSASIMDGKRRRFAGCVNVERVKNPIRLAEALLEHDDRVLAEKGGERFARDLGLPFASPYTKKSREEHRARLHGQTGTVGAVAVDIKGRLAAATSTGGRGYEYPHRVSDTPTSAGNFADDGCAVSATGVGEEIVEYAVASSVCAMVSAGIALEQSVEKLIREAKRHKMRFGLIGVDRAGNYVAASTTRALIWAVATPEGCKIFPKP